MRIVISLSILLALTACGGGGGGTEADVGSDQVIKPQVSFAQSETAIFIPSPYSSDEVSMENGSRVLRTELTIAFSNEATTQEVASLVTSIGAVITSNIKGTRYITIRIPDPGTISDLNSLIGEIEAADYVLFVRKSIFPVSKGLPPNISAGTTVDYINHHLAVRAHNLWAVKGLFIHTPEVAIIDFFGDGEPNSDLDYNLKYPSRTNMLDANQAFSQSQSCINEKVTNGENIGPGDCLYSDSHGYHVSGIISGKFTEFGSGDRDYVTGIYPDTVSLDVLDIFDESVSPNQAFNDLFSRLANYTGQSTILLNLSIGYACDPNLASGICVDPRRLREDVTFWVDVFRNTPTKRGVPLEDYVLVSHAAGNIEKPNTVNQASLGSEYAHAALSKSVILASPFPPAKPLTNTLVVENVRVSGDNITPFSPNCISSTSYINGNIAAVGEDVYSFMNSQSLADFESGTSMAAPQVTGLAAALLSIDPTLSPQQIIYNIKSTSSELTSKPVTGCSPGYSSKVIDAQSAVLALDSTLTSTEANVRIELLDVNEDDKFNSADVALFVEKYDEPSVTPDYSRYDLNGDGMTGGVSTAKFDLDMDMLDMPWPTPDWSEAARYEFDDGSILIKDETKVSDTDVVCFYGLTDLYEGDFLADGSSENALDDCLYFFKSDNSLYYAFNYEDEPSEFCDIPWAVEKLRLLDKNYTFTGCGGYHKDFGTFSRTESGAIKLGSNEVIRKVKKEKVLGKYETGCSDGSSLTRCKGELFAYKDCWANSIEGTYECSDSELSYLFSSEADASAFTYSPKNDLSGTTWYYVAAGSSCKSYFKADQSLDYSDYVEELKFISGGKFSLRYCEYQGGDEVDVQTQEGSYTVLESGVIRLSTGEYIQRLDYDYELFEEDTTFQRTGAYRDCWASSEAGSENCSSNNRSYVFDNRSDAERYAGKSLE